MYVLAISPPSPQNRVIGRRRDRPSKRILVGHGRDRHSSHGVLLHGGSLRLCIFSTRSVIFTTIEAVRQTQHDKSDADSTERGHADDLGVVDGFSSFEMLLLGCKYSMSGLYDWDIRNFLVSIRGQRTITVEKVPGYDENEQSDAENDADGETAYGCACVEC